MVFLKYDSCDKSPVSSKSKKKREALRMAGGREREKGKKGGGWVGCEEKGSGCHLSEKILFWRRRKKEGPPFQRVEGTENRLEMLKKKPKTGTKK